MRLGCHHATGLSDALEVLADVGDVALPLAGGTDLFPRLRDGRSTGTLLLDISQVPELEALSVTAEEVLLGSLSRAADLAASERIGDAVPLVSAAAGRLGSPQIRNRATLGGNLANASPAADIAVALTALDAEVELVSLRGARTIPVRGFALGPGLTRRAPDELIRGVRIKRREGGRSAFVKIGLRRSLACAVASLAVDVVVDPSDMCLDARIAMGAAGPVWIRAQAAEAYLAGRFMTSPVMDRAAELAAEACKPIGDIRASESYRRRLIRIWTRRLLERLFLEARDG